MAELKILHSNLMAYTAKQALADVYPGERPYIINRAGYAGIQRYAQVWGGDNLTDWRTVKFNIATILGMGLSGCSNMGCDIGGFAGPAPEAELLLRWLQNGIFQPRFCLNSANNDNTVTQPWMYEENLPYIRAAYQLRYRLLPTLYSLMYESNQNGMPAWRPLFLEFPNDPKCYTDKNLTFMFGKSILVANVVEKGCNYPHRLPARRLHMVRYERRPARIRGRSDHRDPGHAGQHPHVPARLCRCGDHRGRQVHPQGHHAPNRPAGGCRDRHQLCSVR